MRYNLIVATTALLLGVALYAGIHEAHESHIPEEVRVQFQEWKLTENRLYNSPREEHYRLSIFYQNLQMINAHNSGSHSYTLGINQYADLSPEEFVAKYRGALFLPPKEKSA